MLLVIKNFEGICETIGPRDRIALVGSNGSGKTSLLQYMGQIEPDEGEIEKPDYATVGYLPQDGFQPRAVQYREEVSKAFSGMKLLRKNWKMRKRGWERWTQKQRNFTI